MGTLVPPEISTPASIGNAKLSVFLVPSSWHHRWPVDLRRHPRQSIQLWRDWDHVCSAPRSQRKLECGGGYPVRSPAEISTNRSTRRLLFSPLNETNVKVLVYGEMCINTEVDSMDCGAVGSAGSWNQCESFLGCASYNRKMVVTPNQDGFCDTRLRRLRKVMMTLR